MNAPAATLAERWASLVAEEPRIRIRDAAAKLGVSEAELLQTQDNTQVRALVNGRWKHMVEDFEAFGEVMSLVRNNWVVIEKTGVFEEIDLTGHAGLVLGKDIDLRIFFAHWHSAYAVVNDTGERVLRSIQIFDKHGDAIIKVYCKKAEQEALFEAFVSKYLAPAEQEAATYQPVPEGKGFGQAPPGFDVAKYQADYLAMKDTHDFYPLIMRNRLPRIAALEHAPEGHAWRVPVKTIDFVLEQARDRKINIMVFVGSRGVIEIHTGPVEQVKELGEWINVLDPTFNLHFLRTGVKDAWVVRKPSDDGGIVTSVEFYDENGADVAMLFGARKPGLPELESWRALIADIPKN